MVGRVLRHFGQACRYDSVTLRLGRRLLARGSTTSVHRSARLALTEAEPLQCLHGFGSPGRLQEFFRMSCSIASILTVCRAMIRCIWAFSVNFNEDLAGDVAEVIDSASVLDAGAYALIRLSTARLRRVPEARRFVRASAADRSSRSSRSST